jgi:predicted transcriptional regulator
MAEIGEPDPTWAAELTDQIKEIRDQLASATCRVRASLLEPAIRSLPAGRVEQENAAWLQDRRDEQHLVRAGCEALHSPGPSRGRPSYNPPEHT